MIKYESYKDSTIDWICQIPKHWEIIKPKYKLNRVTRPIDDDDEVVTCFRDGVVTLRRNRREDGFTVSTKEHGYQQIRSGDLVVHEMDGFAGAIGISDSKGKSTPVYTVIKPDENTDLKYFAYLLREMSKTGKIQSLARSIRERTTDFRWNMWSVIKFPFPPVLEQQIISQFLDKKTKQIDLIIEKIEKKIELLQEQKTVQINYYVTKGLDKSVLKKDSNIDWIGQIPSNWTLSRIKYHGDIITGLSFDKNEITDSQSGNLVLRSSNVQEGKVLLKDNVWVKTFIPDKLKVQKGDILICACNGSRELIGKNCILNQDCEGMTWGVFMSVFRQLTSESRYFYWIFNSQLFKSHSGLYSTTTINQLTNSTLKNMIIPYTSDLKEQIALDRFLTLETEKIDQIIQKERRRIFLIKEYRNSLISSAVTGKIRITEDMI